MFERISKRWCDKNQHNSSKVVQVPVLQMDENERFLF
jgi:hypothetical protein